jgi:hypothetical protein
MGCTANLKRAGRRGTGRRIPPEGLFEDGVEWRLGGALHQAEREIELGAEVVAFVAREGEGHEAIRLDLGVGAADAR